MDSQQKNICTDECKTRWSTELDLLAIGGRIQNKDYFL